MANKVELYNNGTLIGTDNAPTVNGLNWTYSIPYTADAGNDVLTAKAFVDNVEVASSGVRNVVVNEGGGVSVTPYHHWKLEETVLGAGVDQMGNENLNLLGDNTYGVPGVDGNAIHLLKADSGNIQKPTILTGSNAGDSHSIGFWWKPTSLTGVNRICRQSEYINLYSSGSDLIFISKNNDFRITAANALVLDTWHHIGIVTGQYVTAKLFLNGALIGESGSLGVNPTASSDFRFGHDNNTAYRADAVIDEIKIWNQRLSNAEMANEANEFTP